MDRRSLQERLCHYHSSFPEERAFAYRGCRLLQESPHCFYRDNGGPHVTASTLVLNPSRDAILLMLHRKLGQWFQPGGHADGDEDVLRVALKECSEETALPPSDIRVLKSDIFDVDIHRIPANRHDVEHEHLDIRFLVEIDDRLAVPGNDESHALRWISLPDVPAYNQERSIHRLLVKIRQWTRQHPPEAR